MLLQSDILSSLSSGSWSDRRDGLIMLQTLIQSQHRLTSVSHSIHCLLRHTTHTVNRDTQCTLSTQTHNVQSSETHNVHCHPSSVCVVCHDCCTCFNRHKAKFAAGWSVVGLLSADNLIVWFAVCINQLLSVSYALKSATETEATEYQQCKLKL